MWVQGYLQSRKYGTEAPGDCPLVRGQSDLSVCPFRRSLTHRVQ